MGRSVTAKLFFTMLGIVCTIVLALLTLTQLSISRGFANYITQLELARFDRLADTLSEEYTATKDWSALRSQDQKWHQLVRRAVEAPPPQGEGRAPLRHLRAGPAQRPPPRSAAVRPGARGPGPPPGGDRLLIGRRLALVDASGDLVAGAPNGASSTSRRPILDGETTVGWLALARSPGVDAWTDASFLRNQLTNLIWLGLAAIVFAAGASWFLARHFLGPVTAVAAGARQLAVGSYSTRVAVDRRDEFGQLAEDFNRMAETLEYSENARRRWVADTSHELRTPLAVLRAKIEALQDGVAHVDAKELAVLHGNVARLTRLADDLHDLARADDGGLALQFQTIDLAAVLASALAEFKERMANAGLTPETHGLDGSVPINGDETRLHQLVANVLENSCRYTDAPGRIEVRLRIEGKNAFAEISDSAPVPPADSFPALFERFHRAETSRSRNHGGSGLGLAIARTIAAAHGGSITASKSDLGGLTITLKLPLHECAS